MRMLAAADQTVREITEQYLARNMTIEEMRELARSGQSDPLRTGLGYAVNAPIVDQLYGGRLHGHRVACWGGSGGSWVVNDLNERLTVAYVMNRHVEGAYDQRHIDIGNATYDCLVGSGKSRMAVYSFRLAFAGGDQPCYH